MNINMILIFIIAYFICMFNPSIIICKKKTGEDIRRVGNGDASIGNTFKVLGRPLGICILILNILEVICSYYIATIIARYLNVDITLNIFKTTVILGCMIGHTFPVIYKFNGGKGIIHFITLMAIFNYKYVVICIAIGLIIIAITKVVAIGNLVGCMLYLILSVIYGCGYIPAIVISLIIILYKHRENIQRMKNRQEETI